MAERKARSLFEEVGADAPVAPAAAPGEAERRKRGARRMAMVWQVALALLVVTMVVVGGMTRLTDSGLSITEWNLVTGVLPPLSDAGWAEELAKYRTIPEGQTVNADMTMAEFKVIYWWEWGHRFLGRVTGLVAVLGLAFLALRRAIPPGWGLRLTIPVLLVGVQGVIGWWMVTSGLTERVDVAPYRLATHLGLAFVILALLVWNALGLSQSEQARLAARRRRLSGAMGWAGGLTALAFVQIVFGAMVAGYDAGRGYTDWPLMQGSFLPPHDTPEAIWQFVHRTTGYLLAFVAALFWWRARQTGHGPLKGWAGLVALAVLAQMTWGIVTLVNGATWGYAIFHQLGAVAMIALILRAKYEAAYPAEQRIERAT